MRRIGHRGLPMVGRRIKIALLQRSNDGPEISTGTHFALYRREAFRVDQTPQESDFTPPAALTPNQKLLYLLIRL
jgi:hypothetical protein